MSIPLNRRRTIDRIMAIKRLLRRRCPNYPPCPRKQIADLSERILGTLLRIHEHDLIHLKPNTGRHRYHHSNPARTGSHNRNALEA
jgi:hypothetical protein